MKKTRKDSFWSKPDGMSIVDVLALGFSGAYCLVVAMAIFGDNSDLAIIQSNMNLPISTILGGYFGDQIVQHWQRSKPESVKLEQELEEKNKQNTTI